MGGKLGEGLALIYFMAQGWWPAKRPRFEAVQTDLLLRRGHVLLLVEVKTRRHAVPLEKALSGAQKERLRFQAKRLAARYPTLTVRLDAVIITPRWPFLRHFINILT